MSLTNLRRNIRNGLSRVGQPVLKFLYEVNFSFIPLAPGYNFGGQFGSGGGLGTIGLSGLSNADNNNQSKTLGVGQDITYTVKTVDIPGKKRESKKIRLGGMSLLGNYTIIEKQLPELYTFDGEFKLGIVFQEKNTAENTWYLFSRWFETTELDSLDNIYADVTVSILSKNLQPNKKFVMRGCFPKVIPPLSLASDDKDNYIILDYTFGYQEFINLEGAVTGI